MEINRPIEQNLTDVLTDKPFRFNVGKQTFSIYPATLGKMQLLKNLYLAMEVNAGALFPDPLAETLRVCRQESALVCRIIAYSTFNGKEEILDDEKVCRRARVFEKELDAEELATLLSLILTSDKTDEFIRYFGIDADREKRAQISRIKGEGNSLCFGGKSIYGLIIDFACQRYGWTLDYVLWGISLVNLNLLSADALTSVYLSQAERKKLGMGEGEQINADDPANKVLIRKILNE